MDILRALTTRSISSNIPKFFVFQFLYSFMLWLPIWVVYLQEDRGLTLTQVTLFDFVFWITMALAEVPTGAVADTLGRKRSLLSGLLLATVSIVLFALAPNLLILMLGNMMWAVAFTFMSGADLAFFYDTLKELGREGEYKPLRGKLATIKLASVAASSVIGGILAEGSLVLPFLIYLVFLVLAIILVFLLVEPPGEIHPETGKKYSYRQTLQITLETVRQSPNLRFTLLYSNLLPLAVSIVAMIFIQPFSRSIGISLTGLGILIFGLHVVNMFASTFSHRLVSKIGEWNWLRMAPILVIGGLFGIGAIGSVTGIFIFSIASFAVFVSRPLVEDIIQRQTASSVRATILSIDSLIGTLLLAFIEPILGVIADAHGLPISFLIMAAATALILFPLLIRWRRHWSPPAAT